MAHCRLRSGRHTDKWKHNLAHTCNQLWDLIYIFINSMLWNRFEFGIHNVKVIRSRYATTKLGFEQQCIYLVAFVNFVTYFITIARLFGEMMSTTMACNTMYIDMMYYYSEDIQFDINCTYLPCNMGVLWKTRYWIAFSKICARNEHRTSLAVQICIQLEAQSLF